MISNQLSILMLSLHGYVSSEPELGKKDTGGQVLFVLDLGKRFSRLGHRVDLITRKFEDQPEIEEINKNFRIIRIPYGGKNFIRKEDMHDYLTDGITNILAHIRQENLHYDVINSHYWDAGWVGQRISEEINVIHVHTPHSLGWWKKHEMQENASKIEGNYRFEERIHKEFRIYHACDHIIATTVDQVEVLTEQYDVQDKNIAVLPPGIDENRFYPVPRSEVEEKRKKYDLRPHDVLLLGRLADNKGYDLFLKAFPTLKTLIPDSRVIMAVGGKELSERDEQFRQRLKDLGEELGITDSMIWQNYIPDEELAYFYRSVGAFVMPSRYEPFGMTAIEAMACGTPTIATRNGALYKYIQFGQTALFADPENPIELATLTSLPLKYCDIEQMLSREGARFARKRFGWTGIARSTLDLFSTLLHMRKIEEADQI